MTAQTNEHDFDSMELNAVANAAASGNVYAIEYIVNKFRSSIKIKAKSYHISGADSDDLIQEGMIGLIKAIRDYSPDKNASFKTFAELCISRQIFTAVKAACCKKHLPLNSYVSLYKEIGDADGTEHYLVDEIDSMSGEDPMDEIIRQEEIDDASRALCERLSDFEMLVLSKYMEGKDYQQIAAELNKTPKSIDNAIQRIKQKASSAGSAK